MYVTNREHAVNEEVPRDAVNIPIYNYVSSNYKPCSWNQLGEKFFKNEKIVSSTNIVTVEYIYLYIFMGDFPLVHPYTRLMFRATFTQNTYTNYFPRIQEPVIILWIACQI